MENEDVVKLSEQSTQKFKYSALLISTTLNFLLLFSIFFLANRQRTITFHSHHDPLVTFEDPVLAPLLQPTPQPTPAPQQTTPTLQQIAHQQPIEIPTPEQDKLNYLVRQLISYGQGVTGAVVSVPDQEDKQNKQEELMPAESNPVAPEIKQESSASEDKQITQEEPKAQDQQPLTPQEVAVLQETAQAIVATLPPESTTINNSVQSRQSPAHTYEQAAPTNRRKITLADLTRSFMKEVRHEKETRYHYDPQQKRGGSMPGVYSPADRTIDGKQLAFQMYATKVFMLMQQAALTFSSLIYAHNDFTTDSLLEITIDHDGKLLKAKLNPPLDEKEIEDAVQTIIQRVGLFPPIPKHFNTDTITLTFPLNIRGSKGFGRYSLSYSTASR